MLRIHCIKNAAAAKAYYVTSDYFLDTPGTWLGEGAKMLGLTGTAKKEHFHALCDNLDPQTGQNLTQKTVEGRRVGWDFNFNATKSVSIARELADPRIEQAHREAVDYAMQHVEKDMATRVRVGGKDEDRITGNLIGMHVIHRTTRPNKDDHLPDMSLHSHIVVFNATHDDVEGKWKAAQIGDIKHDACYYEAIFQNRLAHNLKDLGYGIRKKDKAFEITGVSDDLIRKFSRRTATVEQAQKEIEDKYGVSIGAEAKAKLGATTRLHKVDIREDNLTRYWDSRLTDTERQQLKGLIGKPTFQSSVQKAVQFAIGHLFERNSVVEERKIYEAAIRHGIGSVTPESIKDEARWQGLLVKGKEATTKAVLAEEGRIINFAREGRGTMRSMGKEKPQTGLETGYAIASDSRESFIPFSGASPVVLAGPSPLLRPLPNDATIQLSGQQKGRPDESKRPLAQRAGLEPALPTRDEERNRTAQPYPNDVARSHLATLSPEQQAVCNHIWESTDRVILIEGDAGTGKTKTMQRTIPGIDKPGVFLAPSASASRGTLRQTGFSNADTIAMFLTSPEFREQARNGYIYIDEAPLAGLSDIAKIFDHAKDLNARIILQGDRKQHKSIARGNLFQVLDKYAGLPIGRLTENWRQTHKEYKAAVKAIAKGDILAGYDKLSDLGWVKETPVFDHNKPLVEDYLAGLAAKKQMLIVAPTHQEADEITAEIRKRLKETAVRDKHGKIVTHKTGPNKGQPVLLLGQEEKSVEQLVPLHWTEAEKGDRDRFGDEVIQYFRNSGAFKAGDRVGADVVAGSDRPGQPGHYAVFARRALALSAGDTIRITAGGKTKDGKHRLDNGAEYTVKGFTEPTGKNVGGDIMLSNGWVIDKSFGHLDHAYVATSHASQGKTVDRVLIAMGNESLPAINQESFYVAVSRARERAMIYSDLNASTLREAIQRKDTRKSATDLMGDSRKAMRHANLRRLLKRLRDRYQRLKEETIDATRNKQVERDMSHAR